jgi:hypothetical protein
MIPGAPSEARWVRTSPRRDLPADILERIVRTAFPCNRVLAQSRSGTGCAIRISSCISIRCEKRSCSESTNTTRRFAERNSTCLPLWAVPFPCRKCFMLSPLAWMAFRLSRCCAMSMGSRYLCAVIVAVVDQAALLAEWVLRPADSPPVPDQIYMDLVTSAGGNKLLHYSMGFFVRAPGRNQA